MFDLNNNGPLADGISRLAALPGDEQRTVLNAVISARFTPFLSWAARMLVPDNNFSMNWHLKTMAHCLDQVAEGRIKRLIINLPPRSLKSITTSVALPAWVLGRYPRKKIICASYSADLARDHAETFRRLVNHPDYQAVFPQVDFQGGRDTQLLQHASKGGFRLATSVGGTLTGRGGDILIVDDPIRASGAMSEKARREVNTWFAQTLLSRLDSPEKGAIVIVMQRLHEDDLVGYVTAEPNHGWTILSIPAIAETEQRYQLSYKRDDVYMRPIGSVIDPRRTGLETLKQIRNDLGDRDFNAQYQQNPTPYGGNIIKRTELHYFDDETYDCAQKAQQMVLQSWDTAQKTGEQNDYSVCTTYLVAQTGIFLIHVLRARLEADDLLQAAINQANHFGANRILIEDTQSGTGLAQQLRTRINAKVVPLWPMEDKDARLLANSYMIRHGGLVLPNRERTPNFAATYGALDWLEPFEQELLSFPSGRHDDQVDSLTQALGFLRSTVIGSIRYDREGRPLRANPTRPSGHRPRRDGKPRVENPRQYGELTAQYRARALGLETR
ncbi:MAG: terminase large subunit domain-containing protein [Hyphomicrobiales bacterium]